MHFVIENKLAGETDRQRLGAFGKVPLESARCHNVFSETFAMLSTEIAHQAEAVHARCASSLAPASLRMRHSRSDAPGAVLPLAA